MIKKEEYNKAVEVINGYKTQINSSIIKSYICISCKKNEIKPLHQIGYSSDITDQESECWRDGTVVRASFGYGSVHDTNSFYVAICDECLRELMENNLAINIKGLKKEKVKHGI